MMKLRPKRFGRSNSKLGSKGSGNDRVGETGKSNGANGTSAGEIKWELRPGGMLVQRRERGGGCNSMITVRVSTVSHWHDIPIEPTSTFGELKMVLSLVTGMEPKEQRVLFKGKEREEGEYLHMVGVGDRDKVLVLQDPAIKDRKLRSLDSSCRLININQTCCSY